MGDSYLVGGLQGGADVCEALDAAVFAELAVDLGAGLFLDGVGEREVRDMSEEGFVEREACGAGGSGGSGGLAVGSGEGGGRRGRTCYAVGGDLVEGHLRCGRESGGVRLAAIPAGPARRAASPAG